MQKKLNKNVSVWRGDKTPPTNYHIWIKPDGNIYIYNGTHWEINNTDLITVYNELDIAIQNEITRATKTESSLLTVLNNEIIRSLEADKKLLENDKQYTVVSITEGLEENVKEAFLLRETTKNINIGPVIKIYKDSSLKSVALSGQTLNFTYILVDGTESTVGVDVSAFLAESEFGNGLQVVDHVVSIKRDTLSEEFLSVSADGIKLAGVQAAINAAESTAKGYADSLNTAIDTRVKELETAIGENGSVSKQIAAVIENLDATVGSQTVAEGKHIAVEVVEENGNLTGLTIVESDIASAKEFSEYKTSNNAAVKAVDNAAKAAQSHSESIAGDLAEYETANDARVKAVEDSLAETGSVGAKIKANANAIAVLNGTEEGSVKKAVADAKATIDAYTVNGKVVSTNPVLDATNIKLGTYIAVADNNIDITATTTIADAIKALEDAWTWFSY